METAVKVITTQGLVLAFLPAFIVFGIMFRWAAGTKTAVYATLRMLIQLLLIGYVLVYIFTADQPGIIVGVLVIMLVAGVLYMVEGLREFSPSTLGKATTFSQVLTVAVVLLANLTPLPWWIPESCSYVAFGLVIVSAFDYIYRVSRFVEEARQEREQAGEDLEETVRRANLQSAAAAQTRRQLVLPPDPESASRSSGAAAGAPTVQRPPAYNPYAAEPRRN